MEPEEREAVEARLLQLRPEVRIFVFMSFYPKPETMPSSDEHEAIAAIVDRAVNYGRLGQLESEIGHAEALQNAIG